MKIFPAFVMIVSVALLSTPVVSADPGWPPGPCDDGGYCGNGGGWNNGYNGDNGGWYPGRLLFGPPGCVSGPLGFIQVCK